MNKEDFICLCNFVTTKEVLKLIKENNDISQIKNLTSLGSSCGKCLKKLDDLIKEHQKL
jgi:bacterioferritin-associated ferredoxin